MNMKIGLAFEGGGGKGAYQIGVWKALYERGLDKYIAAVSGTSIGAMNAFLFACGDYELSEQIWTSLTPKQVFSNHKDGDSYICYRQGYFTREGLNHIFNQIDFNSFRSKNMPCYATCLRVDDADGLRVLVDLLGKFTLTDLEMRLKKNPDVAESVSRIIKQYDKFCDQLSDKSPYKKVPGKTLETLVWSGEVKYFKLNQYPNEFIREVLLASSAVPVVFPQTKIEGSYYIDGGIKDNIPIKPLFELENCDKVLVVLSNPGGIIPQNYSSDKIIEIRSQEERQRTLGIFDFTKEGILRRIKQGYDDTLKHLKEFDILFNQ